MNQGDLLRAAREVLSMTPQEFADALGVTTRRMYNYLTKPDSPEFRGFPEGIRVKLDKLLEERFPRGPVTGDWYQQAQFLLKAVEARDHVRTNWNLAAEVVLHFMERERRAIDLYGAPIEQYLSEGGTSPEACFALEPAAKELQAALARSPSAFPEDQRRRAESLLDAFLKNLAEHRKRTGSAD